LVTVDEPIIEAEHSNKFIVDGLGRKSLDREKQAD
jgi:hypothetical protein